MKRFVASVQYNGSSYHGWQRLKDGLPTVQEHIESALSKIADHLVSVVCAGRTDAGVHAVNQIIHFDSGSIRTMRNWVYGANSNLPSDIAINWIQPVISNFHARFSARWRRYSYLIYNNSIRNVHMLKGAAWNYRLLETEYMQMAANYLVGEHDFTSYRTVHCQAANPIRTIHNLTVKRYKKCIVIDIQANAFLHHMVRNIVGSLIEVGIRKKHPQWIKEVLDAKDRKQGGATASAFGLYFMNVGYSNEYCFPTNEELFFIY